MPTPQPRTTSRTPYLWAAPDLANLALQHRDARPEGHDQGLDAALRIASMLQTSLETEKVFNLFVQELRSLVPCDSVNYRNTAQDIEFTMGKSARYTCAYRLILSNESLGEFSISRKKNFTPEEQELVEWLLCALVYPLRNTLLYQTALQASLHDALTGAGNRAAMEIGLRRDLDIAQRHNTPLSIIALDIDHFKLTNDCYGHSVGDNVLVNLVADIQQVVRKSDMVFRYGGEEFVVLLSNTAESGARLLAERIRQRIEEANHQYGTFTIPVTVSLGVACLEPGDDILTLFERADRGLYQAKREGRNRVCIVSRQPS